MGVFYKGFHKSTQEDKGITVDNNNYRVSVIILTTGSSKRLNSLGKLLRSLSKQTIRPHELIIATEVRNRRLEELLRKYTHLKYKIITTGYWNKCRTANKAIRESIGDIMFLLEDDLLLRKDFIENILNTFNLDSKIGCVYSRCIWVYREGLRGRRGVKGFIAKLVGKLSIHGSILLRQVKRLAPHLYDVPVFTMSVACKREALYKAGLYDEGVDEPISGEDYDLALRIRRAGYRIFQNLNAVSYHFTRQVLKKLERLREDPRYLMEANMSEVYFVAKNRKSLGLYIIPHTIYRILESVFWGVRTANLKVALLGIRGTLTGFIKGLTRG